MSQPETTMPDGYLRQAQNETPDQKFSLSEGPSSPPQHARREFFHWVIADGFTTPVRWTGEGWLLPGLSSVLYPAVLQGWSYLGVATPPGREDPR